MAIRMRVNNDKQSECNECGCTYKYTAEMYDLGICEEQFTLCKSCVEKLFQKTLKASCMYNSKLKQPEDLKRAAREKAKNENNKEGNLR